MLGEFLIWISETLFYLSGGVPLIAVPSLMLLWVLSGLTVLILPFFYVSHYMNGNSFKRSIATLFALVVSLLGFLIVVSPGAIQGQMLNECESVDVTVTSDLVPEQTITVRRCRSRNNYYDEFGEWTITQNTP